MKDAAGSLSCGAREVRSPCAWRGGERPGSRVTGGNSMPLLAGSLQDTPSGPCPLVLRFSWGPSHTDSGWSV